MSVGHKVHTLERYEKEFTPTTITASETIPWISVRSGDMVVGAFMQKLVLSADSDTTFGLGDGSDLARFIAATDMSAGAVADVVAPVVAAFPYVYLVADNIDVRYVESGADEANTAKVRMVIYILRAETGF